MKYKVIRETILKDRDYDGFEGEIERQLDKGYILLGAPIVIPGPGRYPVIVQAMIAEDVDKVEYAGEDK